MDAFWFVPLLNCLLASFVMSACMFLFFSLKREIRRFEIRFASKEEFAAALSRATTDAGEARALVAQLEQRRFYADLVCESGGVNLTRQGQVLRLHRRGESIADIASALRLPAGEVKLMIKVYELNTNISANDGTEKLSKFNEAQPI